MLSDSSATYTSDANGNRTSETDRASGQTTTFKYDSGNRLIEVDGPGGIIARYGYDSLGRRISKSAAGVVTKYLYDGWNLRAILDGTDRVIATFSYLPGTPVPLAMVVSPSSRPDFLPGTYIFHTDALGNIIALTDSQGNVTESYDYLSNGKVTVKDSAGRIWNKSTIGNPLFFNGGILDPETGLYHLGYRDLDPGTGTFLEEDPEWSTNQYAFARNSPQLLTDPTGLEPINSIVPPRPANGPCVNQNIQEVLIRLNSGGATGWVRAASYSVWQSLEFHGWDYQHLKGNDYVVATPPL